MAKKLIDELVFVPIPIKTYSQPKKSKKTRRNPTPDEIRERCLNLQKKWTSRQEKRHRAYKPLKFPMYKITKNRRSLQCQRLSV